MRAVVAVLAVAVACSGGGEPVPRAPIAPVVVAAAPADAAAAESPLEPPPLVRRPPLGPRIDAPPEGMIAGLAVTSDAGAALTIDERGGVRLWPTLDGTREPAVVALPAARDVLLARRGAGFVAALRDAAGGLVVARLDADGQVVSRASIAPEPAVVGFASLDAGLLAWRSDQTLALYGDEGQLLARLPAEPSQRILTLGAIPNGALALVLVTSASGGTTTQVRALVAHEHALGWGAAHDLQLDPDAQLAISPGGTYIAQLSAGSTDSAPVRFSVLETASGHEVASGPSDRGGSIAFTDEAHAVVALSANELWYAFDGTPPVMFLPHLSRFSRDRPPLAGAHGLAISAAAGQLVLSTGHDAQYLGYGVPTANLAAGDGHGQILLLGRGSDGAEVLHVGSDLRETAKRTLPRMFVQGIARAGSDDWVFETSRGGTALTIFDAVTGEPSATPWPLASGGALSAEPATGLVAVGDQGTLLHLDPGLHALTTVKTKRGSTSATLTFVPVDPALAGGVRVVRAVQDPSQLRLAWLRDETREPTVETRVQGKLAAVDRAGHAYVWSAENTLSILTEHAQLAQLADVMQNRALPDRQGTRVALRTRAGFAVYTLDGKLLWEHAAQATAQLAWIDDATALLVTTGGVLRLDAATGEVKAARCGWDFRLSPAPLPSAGRSDLVCTQAP